MPKLRNRLEPILAADPGHTVLECPEIDRACAVGVPEEQIGENIHVFIVPRPNGRINESTLREKLAQRLSKSSRSTRRNRG